MRCLNKTYAYPGQCPVCHMKLKLLEANAANVALVHFETWPKVGNRTAIYFRPYNLRPVQIDSILRVAGSLSKDGRYLRVRVPVGELAPLKGASAMLMPMQGYTRPILGSVENSARGKIVIKASRAFPGPVYVSSEIRLPGPTVLAVPLEALDEAGGGPVVFVRNGMGADEAYIPRHVAIGRRGEHFAEVLSGLSEGDTIAGSGLFWLDTQWRMDHSDGPTP